ncbi:MAG: RsmD family RNA methyltransferase [Tissierellia bacterium]|nr:RsmD family RNA methyltransferase [Tissierellia bacterium]
MRVISGTNRGQRLLGPKDSNSRPTEDKIKEAIFNIISPIKKACVMVDLFACTGSIGIEFLSRGAKKVYFSELRYNNIKIMKENLAKTGFLDKALILKGHFLKNLSLIEEDIDYVYIDPPYDSDFYFQALDFISKSTHFENAKLILEADRPEDFSGEFENLTLVFKRKYGKKEISIYERKKDESNLSR